MRNGDSLYGGDLTDLCYGFCAFHRRYLETMALSATGFEIEACFGWFDRSPFTGGEDTVWVARRSS